VTTHPGGSPATMGRRVAARALDLTISLVLVIVLNGVTVAALLGGATMEVAVVVTGLVVLWAAFGLWAMLARAALPGQLVLGLHHVDTRTGQRAGGRTFLKYLVQGCTFGLALLITPLSIQAPNRSWFDRLAGVTLVDDRATDDAPADSRQVTAPPAGWQGEESHLTQVGLPAAVPVAAPVAQQGGMIEAVPFGAGAPALAGNAPPAVERPVGLPVAPRPIQPAPVAHPSPSVPPAPADGPRPVVVLDDGQRIPVDGTVVLGRDPRPSSSLGDAALVVLADQSVSANHLAVGLGPTGPWVMDLRSTNGSSVEQDGAPVQRLAPMTRVAVSPGAVVTVGKRRMTVVAS
jgi:uncharacterized RDD family membrane protein YckC